MADYNITLTANHQSLTADYLPLAAESVQYLTAKVVCETEDWTGREIKAMFGQGCTVHEVSVTDGEITAKQQLNLTAGDWCVWLVGNSARDGEVIPRITTNVAHISVSPTGGTEGNPFPTVPPTVEEQLRADMGNLADLTTKDKSSLVAAINEAAEGGSKDAVKYTPQTLTDEQQAQARKNIGAEKAGTSYTKAEIDSTNEYTGALIDGLSAEVDNLDKAVDQRYVKPASGIPKSDLADDVQTSLAKADTAISLGLTAATPGQIIKVKAVQNGKPMEWEAVDMPSGESYTLPVASPDVLGGVKPAAKTEAMTQSVGVDDAGALWTGSDWEFIAHIDVATDVENGVTAWQYNNLPRYKCIAYKKVNLVGSSTQTPSGCSITINNEGTQQSGMSYGKSGSPQSCIGMIYVTPFGWAHCKTGDSNNPTNYAIGGVSAMYNALPLSDNAITSIKLSAHSLYKIASGEIWLYGKKG